LIFLKNFVIIIIEKIKKGNLIFGNYFEHFQVNKNEQRDLPFRRPGVNQNSAGRAPAKRPGFPDFSS